VRTGTWLHLPAHAARLSEAEERLAQKLLPMLTDGGFDPPWVRTLAKDCGATEPVVRQTLASLARRGAAFQVVKDLYYPAATIDRLAALARDCIAQPAGLQAASFRDATGLGRKRAIQLLEFFDRVGYTREIATLVARNLELTAAEVKAGRVLFDILDVSYRSGLRLPAELTLLAKALFNLDGVTRALSPGYTPFETIREYGNQIAMARAQRDMSPRRIYQIALESSELLAALPHRLDKITQRLANNDLQTSVDVPQIPSLIVALQKVANRIFSGLVLAGLLVASAMLLPYWRTLGTAGFIVAAVLGLYIVLAIMVSDRKRDVH